MPSLFVLKVQTDEASRSAALRLVDEHGRHVGFHEVKLGEHPASAWEGAFDTRRHVKRMQSDARPAAELLAGVGEFLAERVLGAEIMAALAKDGIESRTLVVELPDASNDKLAAAFARVPWEIARPKGEALTLLQRNVVVRAVTTAGAGAADAGELTVPADRNETVRVLLVFAEAPGSRPLAMRLERERLLQLFFDEVLPSKLVEVDVLCHGVTRGRLTERVRDRGGYHVVHWSGHGHHDLLEIGLDEGETRKQKTMTGGELVTLMRKAGGFVPDLFFLSACHSGSLVNAKDWETLRASLREDGGPARETTPAVDELLDERQGYTGTALELLRAGVPQVVAMRYEVGDAYARRLARRFYRRLLADRAGHPVERALALARTELVEDRRASEHHAVDHATPLVFSGRAVRFVPKAKRSPQADKRNPKPQPLLGSSHDLDRPHNFVGRGAELTQLGREWLDRGGAPIASIQGLAGLGKTSLAAEAIHLFHDRFDHVLAFTARGGNLSFEELLRQLDQKLAMRTTVYRERCADDPNARVFIAATKGFTGDERHTLLRDNLANALLGERFLLVLDNLEAVLRPSPRADGTYDAQDPEWDRSLSLLGERLNGSGSRVLVTSRHRPAALAAGACVTIALGPLPMGEAALFFQGHEALRRLSLSANTAESALAKRVLTVSRGHPLILQRLATVAREGKDALSKALDRIQGEGYRTLPDVFAETARGAQKEQERRYLDDVAIGAVDLLIERLSPDARRLLWLLTRAFEPVSKEMLTGVWAEHSYEDDLMSQLAAMASIIRQLPPAAQEQLRSMPADERAALDAWIARGEQAKRDAIDAPFVELRMSGLMHLEGAVMEIGFHEIVAERAAEWMKDHPEERGSRSQQQVWTAYGERYGALFQSLRVSRSPGSHDVAVEMGKRGIRYLARARAFDELGAFASQLVTSTEEPAILGEVSAELGAVVGAAPPGSAGWSARAYLADALKRAGRSDEALGLYARAAEEAEAAGDWRDVGWIAQNWASALTSVGDLDAAKATYLRSADAERRAGAPRVDVVASELEALRIDLWKRAWASAPTRAR